VIKRICGGSKSDGMRAEEKEKDVVKKENWISIRNI